MSTSPTVTPTVSLYNEEDTKSLLYLIIIIVIVGFIYLCVQCCLCLCTSDQYSSTDSFPVRQSPTTEDNEEEASGSYTSTYYESSSEYY